MDFWETWKGKALAAIIAIGVLWFFSWMWATPRGKVGICSIIGLWLLSLYFDSKENRKKRW